LSAAALRTVDFSSLDSVAVLSFPEQPEYPRLSRDLLRELRDHLHAVCSSSLFCGVVIAANSRSFAVGAKIEEVSALSGLAAFEFARLCQGFFQEIEFSPLPVVSAIRRFCLGGGLDLALACHGRVAAYDASFGCPGAALGLITGWGGTERLPRRVGRAAALQMLVTGERVPATQALALGLVDEIVPAADLVPTAVRAVRRISAAAERVKSSSSSRPSTLESGTGNGRLTTDDCDESFG
jgi:enoyl-CoA hydratase